MQSFSTVCKGPEQGKPAWLSCKQARRADIVILRYFILRVDIFYKICRFRKINYFISTIFVYIIPTYPEENQLESVKVRL